MLIELLADGGIRVHPPDGRAGIATAAEMLRWVDVAAAGGTPIKVTGHVNSPSGQALVGQIAPRAAQLTIEDGEPEPWSRRWTSLMWAAEHGLVDETVDLLARGASVDAPRRSETPYRLAMRHGHVPVMVALRAAGDHGPRVPPPPNAPDAIVMRTYIGWIFWWLAPVVPIISVIVAVATREWMWLVVGAVVGVAIAALGLLAHTMAGRTRIAVDGAQLYYHRLARWRGPVDLRQLVAIGVRESVHRRSPTLLRLANLDDGESFSRRTRAGFDAATIKRLESRPGLRVLTIYLAWNFLRPGLERYIAAFVDPQQTLITTNAQPLFRETGRP